MSIPVPFSDIGKLASDLLSKDYPVGSAKLEVKTVAPNGVTFSVTGNKDNKTGAINAELKYKYNDFKNGLTFTESVTTSNLLTTELEIVNSRLKGLKLNLNGNYLPTVGQKNAKIGAEYKQNNVNTRAYLDVFKGPSISGDVVVGRDGFLVGADVAYDVLDGRVSRYNASLGYSVSEYALALQASHAFSVFSASYYHRVNTDVEAGAKAVWDTKATTQNVGLEVGAKLHLDRDAFVKAKIDNNGRLGVGYTQLLRRGVKFSIGGLFDTTRFNENAHKLGVSLALESN